MTSPPTCPPLAFSTLATPTWTWFDVLKAGPGYGYQGVEVRQLQGQTELLGVADLARSQWPTRRSELDSAGFVVCGLASSIRFDDPTAAQRQQHFDTGRKYLDLAVALGARFIRVFGDRLPPSEPPSPRAAMISQVADGLRQLGEAAAGTGVDILLETHGDFTASAPCADVMQRVDLPQVGLVWDTHHPWRFQGESLASTWQQIGRWVRHTHWKDSVLTPQPAHRHAAATAEQQHAEALAKATNPGHQPADYVLFGEGEFPIRDCWQLLQQHGYDGWVSLEWEQMWHPHLAGPDISLPQFPRAFRRILNLGE
jgi:sugar phosphate isomerase/epimerase